MSDIDRNVIPASKPSLDTYIPIPEKKDETFYFEDVAKLPVLDEDGQMIPLDYLYKDSRSIIIFARDFMCYVCSEYAEDLAKIPEFYLKDANVRLIIIGLSPYTEIKEFRQITGFPYEIYVDKERDIYKALGLLETADFVDNNRKNPHIKSSVIWGIMKSTWRAIKNGGPPEGNMSQQGGQCVVGPGEQVLYFHSDKNMFDSPPINDLLEAAGVQQVDFGASRIIKM